METFLTPRHHTLRRIGRAANIFAWLALAFYVLRVLGSLQLAYQQLRMPGLVPEPGAYILNLALSVLSLLMDAAVFWLVLRGVALGLSMIIETDVNYRRVEQRRAP